MPAELEKPEQCVLADETTLNDRKIPLSMHKLLATCRRDDCFDHVNATPIPSLESVIAIIHQARRIPLPGYFSPARLDSINLEYRLGQETTELFKKLSRQVILSIQHDCIRYNQPCSRCTQLSHETGLRFIETLPGLREILGTDIRVAMDGDPAAKSHDEAIFCYPGLFAVTVYRMAHVLHGLEVPLLPRIMTEYAHSLTGIDIDPGAKIGESFFIDHGTGVVIGETTEIGNRVRIYQGVTLTELHENSARKPLK